MSRSLKSFVPKWPAQGHQLANCGVWTGAQMFQFLIWYNFPILGALSQARVTLSFKPLFKNDSQSSLQTAGQKSRHFWRPLKPSSPLLYDSPASHQPCFSSDEDRDEPESSILSSSFLSTVCLYPCHHADVRTMGFVWEIQLVGSIQHSTDHC